MIPQEPVVDTSSAAIGEADTTGVLANIEPENSGGSKRTGPLFESLSRSELVARAGMTDDILTFWIRHDLIQADGIRLGRGYPLRYPFYEANIAAIMLQLRVFGANIETMKGIAGIYRNAIAWGTSFGHSPSEMLIFTVYLHEPITNFAKIYRSTGKLDEKAFARAVYEHLGQRPDAKAQVSPKFLEFTKRVDLDEWKLHASAYGDMLVQPRVSVLPVPIFFWKSAAGWRRGESTEGQAVASEDGAFATIAIDMLGVLYHVWNKADPASRGIEMGELAE